MNPAINPSHRNYSARQATGRPGRQTPSRYWLRVIPALGMLALVLFLLANPGSARAETVQQTRPLVIRIETRGPLSAAMREYLQRGITVAEQRGADLLIMQLDTPGGSIQLMSEMVTMMRDANVPIVVYVAPAGAIAGSAGTILTLAGHAAAMAPETAIGAASPVGGSGEDLGEAMEAKTKEAIKAIIRSLTENRRPIEAIALAEETVENALAATAQEALDVGMIDFIAKDVDELLSQLNGFEVVMEGDLKGETRTLNTENALVETLPPSIIEQLLATLTNPNIVFILLTIGIQAILIELLTPGGWVAGFVGVVMVSIAAFGIGLLGANWLGLIFIVLAFILFILEIKTTTSGALTAAGVGAFIIGALVLFNSPGTPPFQRVSVPLVVGAGVGVGATFFALVMFAVRSFKTPLKTGRETVVGARGRVQVALNPTGVIQLAGEQWTARLEEGTEGPVPRGALVEVTAMDGNHLIVRPSPNQPPA